VSINGTDVDDHVLKPGWTSYTYRTVHDTTDVSTLLRSGRNAIGVRFAGGWATERFGFRTSARRVYADQPAVAVQLRIDYVDGRRTDMLSDGTWRTSTGPIVASGIYPGEVYDARAEIPGWSEPGFDDSGWRPAARRPDLVTPQARVAPPVRRFERLPVREVITSPSGRTLLDFGQNLVGRLRLEVAGPAGTVITLRHAEVLEHGELGTRPLRGAVATDRYTLRGGGVETWEPEFTFHGFRYAEVEGWPGTLDPGAITGCTRTWSGGSAATSSRSPPTARSATSAWAGPGTSRSSPRRRPSCSTAGTSWRPGWSTWPASSRLPTAWCHPSSRTFFASSVPRPRGAMPRLWCRACSMSGSVIWMCSWPSSRACGRGRTCCCAWPGSGTCGRATSSTATGSTRPPPPEYPAEAKTSQDLVATAYVFRSADLTSRAGELLGDAAAAAYYAESAAAFVGRSWPSTSRRRAG
jgi:alpha-L-rhamnosidase